MQKKIYIALAHHTNFITQQKEVVDGITAPEDKAAAYKKVFGSCCPTPQYTGGCGCGKCTE